MQDAAGSSPWARSPRRSRLGVDAAAPPRQNVVALVGIVDLDGIIIVDGVPELIHIKREARASDLNTVSMTQLSWNRSATRCSRPTATKPCALEGLCDLQLPNVYNSPARVDLVVHVKTEVRKRLD